MPRVYVDFNRSLGDALDIMCLGTLRDLCEAQTRLQDGLPLTIYSDSSETEDLEADAIARWVDGRWIAEYTNLGDVPRTYSRDVREWFPCFGCGVNIADQLFKRGGLNADTRCEHCGVRVHTPIDPPSE